MVKYLQKGVAMDTYCVKILKTLKENTYGCNIYEIENSFKKPLQYIRDSDAVRYHEILPKAISFLVENEYVDVTSEKREENEVVVYIVNQKGLNVLADHKRKIFLGGIDNAIQTKK